jgi:enamine deaminase RidA (YjgF/YER057c/UK114 family)
MKIGSTPMADAKLQQLNSPESRLENLGIQLPAPPTRFGSYVDALQTGNLLFLSGMLPVFDHKPASVGWIGRELDAKAGREAARIAALSTLAAVKNYLGSLDRVKRVVRLGIFMATSGDFVDLPALADGASDLFRKNMAVRSVIGVASLPLGVPIELEATFELNE